LVDECDKLFGSAPAKKKSIVEAGDLEEIRRKIQAIPDQVERCREIAYYRELGYDV